MLNCYWCPPPDLHDCGQAHSTFVYDVQALKLSHLVNSGADVLLLGPWTQGKPWKASA